MLYCCVCALGITNHKVVVAGNHGGDARLHFFVQLPDRNGAGEKNCGHGALDHMALPTTGSEDCSNFICIIRPAQYFQTADRGKVVARFLIQFAHIIGMFLR